MLEATEREVFDLRTVVAGCVEGYRAAYPKHRFEHTAPEAPVWLHGVPDAFAQLLDKLVENAVDFAPPASVIRVTIEAHSVRSPNKLGTPGAILAVENEGPPLPEPMVEHLFDSMVTAREGAGEGGEHLGLGLHIVRLIAEFHGGRARASNLPGHRGVRFAIEVPRAPQNA
jgi:signal transduction histidine kinase